jgi:hypothetical protein
MMSGTELVKYNAACAAIAKAHRVDEAKSIRDKHLAIAAYAKQARNKELERMATEIRIKAERHTGVLLKVMPKAKGARGNPGGRGAPIERSNDATAQPETLEKLGITKDQSSQWQKLAEIPEAEFERALTAGAGAISKGSSVVKVGQHNLRVERDNKIREVAEEEGKMPLVPYEGRLPDHMELGTRGCLHKLANRLINAGNYHTDELMFEGSCEALGNHVEFVYSLQEDIARIFDIAEKIRAYANTMEDGGPMVVRNQ